MNDFINPPNHINFLAKKLCDEVDGKISDISIAHIQPGGGGPKVMHSHAHCHLFIVVSGEAKINFDSNNVIVKENESYLIKANVNHSVWNNSDGETVMIGITLK